MNEKRVCDVQSTRGGVDMCNEMEGEYKNNRANKGNMCECASERWESDIPCDEAVKGKLVRDLQRRSNGARNKPGREKQHAVGDARNRSHMEREKSMVCSLVLSPFAKARAATPQRHEASYSLGLTWLVVALHPSLDMLQWE